MAPADTRKSTTHPCTGATQHVWVRAKLNTDDQCKIYLSIKLNQVSNFN